MSEGAGSVVLHVFFSGDAGGFVPHVITLLHCQWNCHRSVNNHNNNNIMIIVSALTLHYLFSIIS